MVTLKTQRLSSATLVESLVALVILFIISVIIGSVIFQTESYSLNIRSVKAFKQIQAQIYEDNANRDYANEQFQKDEFTIIKFVKEENFNNVVISYGIYNQQGKLIIMYNAVFKK